MTEQNPPKWFVFDLEILTNFVSVVLYNPYTYKWDVAYDLNTTATNVRNTLLQYNQPGTTMVGFNNSLFDDPLVGYILAKEQRIEDLYQIAQDLISAGNNRQLYQSNVFKYRPKIKYNSIDLLMLQNPVDRVSLKKYMISLNAPRIQDMPIDHTHLVQQDEVEEIISYNKNDVYGTSMLFVSQYDEIMLRYRIRETYGVYDVLSSCRSRLAKQLLAKMYEKQSGIPYYEFKNWQTTYEELSFADCIHPKVQFKSKNLNDLVDKIKQQKFTDMSKKIKFEQHVLIGNTKYTVATGGLHSEHNPTILKSTSNIKLWDWDFGSYYPFLMLTLEIFPKHLGKQILTLLNTIVMERINAKQMKDYTVADTLKIVVNSVYGLLKYQFGWFFDPKALYSVTLNGQLFILMIIESLENRGIPVVYANTDGWMAKCPVNKIEEMKTLMSKWSGYFDIPLEDEPIDKMLLRDVNNYSLITTNGTFKQKGEFIIKPKLGKSYNAPIIALAIHEWFYNNVKLEETITQCDDVSMFFMTQNVDKSKFVIEYHTIEDHQIAIKQLQYTNRYIAARGLDSGVLYKRHKETDALENMLAQSQVYIMNDWDMKKPFESYPLNIQYYIARAEKMKRQFVEQQQSLFT